MLQNKRKLSVILAVILMVLTSVTVNVSSAEKKLESFGYSKEQAKQLVTITNCLDIVIQEESKLQDALYKKVEVASRLGITDDQINELNLNEETLYTNTVILQDLITHQIDDLVVKINDLEKVAKSEKIKYSYDSSNIYDRYTYLNKVISKKQDSIIKEYQSKLTELGYSKDQLKALNQSDKNQTIESLKDTYNKEVKKLEELGGFQSQNLQDQAMRMFREVNEYRASLGLKPYTYNSGMQSCVFKEARAYANNKNPHNWLCGPAANENAGLAGINSDYVKAAMDFFKSDPPHEAVLSGNYKSVAIAFVEKDGMVYMILDVFH